MSVPPRIANQTRPDQTRPGASDRCAMMAGNPSLPQALGSGRHVVYPAGTRIYRMGDAVTTVQVVMKGFVWISTRNHGGDGFIGMRARGWPMSAVPALLGLRQLVDATAACDCEVAQFFVDEFHRLRCTDRDFAEWLQHMLARHAYEQQSRWLEVAPKGTLQGMVWLLIQCFRAAGRVRSDGAVVLEVHLPVSRLAEWLDVTRQTASEFLAKLRVDGLLAVERGWLVVPRGSRLHARIMGRPFDASR